MNDTCFYTHTTPERYQMAKELVSSVRTFYPDIPMFIYPVRTEDLTTSYIKRGRELSSQYKRVIHINADALMCSPCPRLFEVYDLALSGNNCEYQFEGNQNVKTYMNIGLIAVTNTKVYDEWEALLTSRPIQNAHDQNMLNLVYWSGDYNVLHLDTETETYGIQHMGQFEHMYLKNDTIMVGEKKVCIFHAAGSEWKTDNKINYEKIQSSEVRARMEELRA